MNTLWYKVWADLWLAKSRTLLAIASIAAGVFCVGTLFGMIALQLAKMDRAHQLSEPSHISLILRQDADAQLLQTLSALEGVAGIDTLTPLTVRFRAADGTDWQTATLIFRTAPPQQQFDKTTLQSGHWPQAAEVAIEYLSAQQTGLMPGDRVELNYDQGVLPLMISGIVRHPFIKPPKFGGQAHFFIDSAALQDFKLKPGSFRQLLVQIKAPYSVEQARGVAQQIKTLLASRGIDVNVSLLQDPQRHWGRPFVAGIDQVLQWLALVSLLLASVLIVNSVSAHINQQSDQIGVMKALGASLWTIARLYYVEVLVVALLAILLAVLPSLALAHFSACRLLALFNIDCGGFDYAPQALLIMLVGGLLVPLLAASWPIVRGATLTVREAIASYGLGADFGSSRFDRWLERFGARCLPTLYAAALGNLFRRKGRLLLTQMVLLIAGLMFLVLMTLVASLNLTLDNEMARSRYNLRLGFSADQSVEQLRQIITRLPGESQTEFWQRLPMLLSNKGAALRQQGSLGAQLLAVPAAGVMYQPRIEQGRWFEDADRGQRHLVISADTAALNQLQPGDSVTMQIGSQSEVWQVIGTYRWLAGNNFMVEPVYAPLETVNGITRRSGLATFALLSVPGISNREQEAELLQTLTQDFDQQQIKLDVYTTQARLEQRQFARNQFRSVIATLMGLASMVVAVGAIGLSGTLAISVMQRKREIAVLRAIGAASGTLFRLVMMEGLLHGLMAWLLTVPLAVWIAEPLADQLGLTMLSIRLDYQFDYQASAAWLLIMLMLALLAAYWPARQAMKITVKEGLG